MLLNHGGRDQRQISQTNHLHRPRQSTTNNYQPTLTSHHEIPALSNQEEEDDPLKEDYIGLLRYRDAFHVLGLDAPADVVEMASGDNDNVDEENKDVGRDALDGNINKESTVSGEHVSSLSRIKQAYLAQRTTTLCSLQQIESSGKRGFAISRWNYLELRLRALDQARTELLGDDGADGSSSVFDKDDGAAGGQYSGDVNEDSTCHSNNTPATDTFSDIFDDPLPNTPKTNKTSESEQDELQTIDIYFQPSCPSRPRRHSKDYSTVSSVSWLSKESDLNQVLGPLHGDTRNDTRNDKYISKDCSPRLVLDAPYFDNKEMPQQQLPRPPKHTSNVRVEAARKGVLRALSEDDSDCLTLDEYDEASLLRALEESPEERVDENNGEDEDENLCKHESERIKQPSQVKSISSHSHRSKSSSKSYRSKSSQKSSNSHHPIITEEEYNHMHPLIDSDNVDDDDYYDSLLQSGIELAEDICGVINGCCWDVIDGIEQDEGNSPNESFQQCSKKMEKNREDEPFNDKYTSGTDGDSTAFNTTSSFGHGDIEVRTPESYLEKRYQENEKKMLV